MNYHVDKHRFLVQTVRVMNEKLEERRVKYKFAVMGDQIIEQTGRQKT
jgi:hypothetical protein